MYSLSALALKSHTNFHMVFMEFIEHTLQFILKTVLQIINFILCCGMIIQNNDVTPAAILYYVSHPITNKLNPQVQGFRLTQHWFEYFIQ
jgi:hypothetical protein